MNGSKKAWINIIMFVATLGLNFLGAMGYINGFSQKAVSDRYLTLITPAPSTFAIWSVIYLLLLASVIAMIVRKDPYYEKVIEKISYLFWISCALNMLWIVAFSYLLIELSALLIFSFFVTLTMICQRLIQVHEKNRWLLPATFGLYTGWLLIATVVNISVMLVKLDWNGFGIEKWIWTAIVLLAAYGIAYMIERRLKNAVLPLSLAWAYFGIYKSFMGFGSDGVYKLLEIVALTGVVGFAGMAVYHYIRNNRSLLPYEGK